MKKYFVLLCLTFQTILIGQNIEPLVQGEIHRLESKILNEQRQINIHLPLNFNKEKAYPVVYLLDGSLHEDFTHVVGLFQYFQLQFKAPEFIIVGISNVDRKRDFTFPTTDKSLLKDVPTSGGSAKFIQFLESELIPYISSHFKTSERYLIGQSLGGLVATEILFQKTELFTHYLIVSPSLWWDNESLLKKGSEQLTSSKLDGKFIYVSVGQKEHRIMQKDAKSLYELLQSRLGKKTQLEFNPMEKEDHATILHNSLYEGLQRLFPHKL